MKKAIALICLLAMILPLCACSGGNLSAITTEEGTVTQEKKTAATKEEEEKGEIVYPEGFSVGFGRVDISGPLPVDV